MKILVTIVTTVVAVLMTLVTRMVTVVTIMVTVVTIMVTVVTIMVTVVTIMVTVVTIMVTVVTIMMTAVATIIDCSKAAMTVGEYPKHNFLDKVLRVCNNMHRTKGVSYHLCARHLYYILYILICNEYSTSA